MGTQLNFSLATGLLSGAPLQQTVRTISDMKGYYRDEEARQGFDPGKVVYCVQAYFPEDEEKEGGLFFGNTSIEPGMVGDEYFMTKGHFHRNRNRSEYYITIAGAGGLVLMSENRQTVFEKMSRGTVHHIPFNVAHRVANTGDSVLTFLACWPSDAGHDYATIVSEGFSARLRKINGVTTLVEEQ